MSEQDLTSRLSGAKLPPWELLPDFGLYMDQLTTYVERCFAGMRGVDTFGLTPAMINNYVKCQLIDRPHGKKYNRDSLAQLLMVCELKQTTSVDVMKRLLHPSDGPDTETMYQAFRGAQDRILDSFSTHADLAEPLMCALEAATWQLICRMLLADSGAEK